MTKTLLTFGDSWPAAAKLTDRSLAFPKLIAQGLEQELIDLSAPATSIDHTVMAFLDFLENTYSPDNEYTALFCLTDPSRAMIWRPGIEYEPQQRDTLFKPCMYTHELQINNVDEWSVAYYKSLHTSKLELYNYQKDVTLLRLLCAKHNIKDFFVHNFYDPDFTFKLIDEDRFYPLTLTEMLNSRAYKEFIPSVVPEPARTNMSRPHLTNHAYIGDDGHPTVAGHQRIAEVLTEWIKNNE